MRPRLRAAAAVLLAGALVSGAACRLFRLERALPPPYADFLNGARYIITAGERREFLETPDEGKDGFIAAFWERRDPDPTTPENEYKIEFDDRVQNANRLFASEGIPGWLTDRGRIFILFGPPSERILQPVGGESLGRCQEIWYYWTFPVVFVDANCSGQFKLVSYDLTAIRETNLAYMHALAQAQSEAQKPLREDPRKLDFTASLKVGSRTGERIEGLVSLGIPYLRLWLRSEGASLATSFEVTLDIRVPGGESVWKATSVFDVSLSESGMEAKRTGSYPLEVPFLVDDPSAISRLGPGRAEMAVVLINRTGGETVRKILFF